MCIFSLLWVCGCGLCRLVCSVNMLYMELSYTGSLDRSTRASEHVTVQISIPVRLPGWQVFILFDLLEWEHVTVQISYACKTTAGIINCF